MSVSRASRRPLPSFVEVKPQRTTPQFQAYVGKALVVLQNTKTPLAQATYKYITSGKVRIDEVTDLTSADYLRARKDLAKWSTAFKPGTYASLSNLKSPASKALDRLLNGYMWDDRIYVARGLTPHKLASTLIHETNHFINRSEEHYRGPTQGLLEEYRAFYVEKLFSGVEMTPARCQSLKLAIAKDYGFTKAHVDQIPDVPPGLLVPPT